MKNGKATAHAEKSVVSTTVKPGVFQQFIEQADWLSRNSKSTPEQKEAIELKELLQNHLSQKAKAA